MSNGTSGRDSFERRVGQATIYGYRAAIGAMVLAVALVVVGAVLNTPTVQHYLDARVPVAYAASVGWLTAKWSFAWPVCVAALLATLWAGTRIGRWSAFSPSDSLLELAPDPNSRIPASPAQLQVADSRALGVVAGSDQFISTSMVANRLGVRIVTARAALDRLEAMGLVHRNSDYVKLTKPGIAYVDKHSKELFGNGVGLEVDDD